MRPSPARIHPAKVLVLRPDQASRRTRPRPCASSETDRPEGLESLDRLDRLIEQYSSDYLREEAPTVNELFRGCCELLEAGRETVPTDPASRFARLVHWLRNALSRALSRATPPHDLPERIVAQLPANDR